MSLIIQGEKKLWVRIISFFMVIISILFLLSACEEVFWPDLGNKYDKLLVVEGSITNQPGPYTIKLSQSTTIQYPEYNPLSGYEVIIADDAGNSETLNETGEGVYTTAANGIRGIVGRSYKIIIHDPVGNEYTSDFEKLFEPTGIDTVFAETEYRSNENFSFDIPGYQFYISTKAGNADTNYYRWKLEQTYKYQADFLIFYYYDGQLHIFPDADSFQTCFNTNPIYSIFTTSTAGLTVPEITNYPLHYISFDQRELSIRYSLLIEQQTISGKAYEYWESVKEQNTVGGNLYTKLPYQVKGNVYKRADENEPVLGYFQVAGSDVKRIYFNRPLPPGGMFYPICELSQPDYEEYGWMFRSNDPREWPRYVTENAAGDRAVPNPVCLDCRESGGSLNKPEFWID